MIRKIKLSNFRSFGNLELEINNSFVIFSGKNAVGKTSILEAIFILSSTKSERTRMIDDVIKFDSSYALIEILENNKFKAMISKDSKSFFINDKKIDKYSDFIGKLNTIFISPSDISIVDGVNQDKRRFLDLNLSILDKVYLDESLKYKKLLAKRNNILKENNVDLVLLSIITDMLIKSLDYIVKKRIKFIDDLNFYLNKISSDMGIDDIKLLYEPTYDIENIKNTFIEKEKKDLFYKSTTIGAHRDSFKILINNLDAKKYASFGQLRIIYICIKLALKESITKEMGEPILLLDDIFQALDNKKIEAISNYVKSAKQVFITTTSVLEIPDDIIKESVVFRIGEMKNGTRC